MVDETPNTTNSMSLFTTIFLWQPKIPRCEFNFSGMRSCVTEWSDSDLPNENIVPIFKRRNIIRLWHFFRTFKLLKMTTQRLLATCGSYYGLIQHHVSEGRVPQLRPFEDLVNSYSLKFCNIRIHTATSECIRSRKIQNCYLLFDHYNRLQCGSLRSLQN